MSETVVVELYNICSNRNISNSNNLEAIYAIIITIEELLQRIKQSEYASNYEKLNDIIQILEGIISSLKNLNVGKDNLDRIKELIDNYGGIKKFESELFFILNNYQEKSKNGKK